VKAGAENDLPTRNALFASLAVSPLKIACVLSLSAWLLCVPAKAAVAAAAIFPLQGGAAKPEPVEIRELNLEQPIERGIAQGQSHLYRLTLTAGQFLNIKVEQKALDVGVELSNPAGEVVVRLNWEDTGFTESFWAQAETSGEYQLKITAVDVAGADPRYVVRLEKLAPLETAAPADQSDVKAHQLFWEAGLLRDQGGEQSWREATEKYRQALSLWRALKDVIGEASALHELGYVYGRLGESQKEIEAYNQALLIWRQSKRYQKHEANTLHNLASLNQSPQQKLEILKDGARLEAWLQ
jgi:tetratricopeptide (TPR) repeat protein